MKQTAVEYMIDWVERQLDGQINIPFKEAKKEAKELEKQQMADAVVWFDDTDRKPIEIENDFERYFENTFKK